MIIEAIVLGLISGAGAAAAAARRAAAAAPPSPVVPAPATTNQNTARGVALKRSLLAPVPVPGAVPAAGPAAATSVPAVPAPAVTVAVTPVAAATAPQASAAPVVAATVPAASTAQQAAQAAATQAAIKAQQDFLAAQQAKARAEDAARAKAAADSLAAQKAAYDARQAQIAEAQRAAAAMQARATAPGLWYEDFVKQWSPYVDKIVANQPGLAPAAAALLRAKGWVGYIEQYAARCGSTPSAYCVEVRDKATRMRSDVTAAQAAADAEAAAAKAAQQAKQQADAAAALAAQQAAYRAQIAAEEQKIASYGTVTIPKAIIDGARAEFTREMKGASYPAGTIGALYMAHARASAYAQRNLPLDRADVRGWLSKLAAFQATVDLGKYDRYAPIPASFSREMPMPLTAAVAGLAGLHASPARRHADLKWRLLAGR